MVDEEERSLTTGSVPKKIAALAFPIFLSNLFQQLYNAVDSLIVGQFIGRQALAAVSSSSSLIYLLVGFINGGGHATTGPRPRSAWSRPFTRPSPWVSPPVWF